MFKLFVKKFFNILFISVLIFTNINSLVLANNYNSKSLNVDTLAPLSSKDQITTKDILNAWFISNGSKILDVVTRTFHGGKEYIFSTVQDGKKAIIQFLEKKDIKQFENLEPNLTTEHFISFLNKMNSFEGVLATSNTYEFETINKQEGTYKLLIRSKKTLKVISTIDLNKQQIETLQKEKRLNLSADDLSIEKVLSINDVGILSLDFSVHLRNGQRLDINGKTIEIVNINTESEEVEVKVINKDETQNFVKMERYILEQVAAEKNNLSTFYHTTSLDAFLKIINSNYLVASRIGTYAMDKAIYDSTSFSNEEAQNNRANRLITDLDYSIINKHPFLSYFQLWASKNHPLQYNQMQAFFDNSRGRKNKQKIILVFNELTQNTENAVAGKKLLQPDALKVDRLSKHIINLSRVIIDNSNQAYNEKELTKIKQQFKDAINLNKQKFSDNTVSEVEITVLDKKVGLLTNIRRSLITFAALTTKIGLIAHGSLTLQYFIVSMPHELFNINIYPFISFLSGYGFATFVAGLVLYLIEIKDIFTTLNVISLVKNNSVRTNMNNIVHRDSKQQTTIRMGFVDLIDNFVPMLPELQVENINSFVSQSNNPFKEAA